MYQSGYGEGVTRLGGILLQGDWIYCCLEVNKKYGNCKNISQLLFYDTPTPLSAHVTLGMYVNFLDIL